MGKFRQFLTDLSACHTSVFSFPDNNFLFVLRFYGPVNPMGSCRAQSVYLTTCLLSRQYCIKEIGDSHFISNQLVCYGRNQVILLLQYSIW